MEESYSVKRVEHNRIEWDGVCFIMLEDKSCQSINQVQLQ